MKIRTNRSVLVSSVIAAVAVAVVPGGVALGLSGFQGSDVVEVGRRDFALNLEDGRDGDGAGRINNNIVVVVQVAQNDDFLGVEVGLHTDKVLMVLHKENKEKKRKYISKYIYTGRLSHNGIWSGRPNGLTRRTVAWASRWTQRVLSVGYAR
jgi:hypothetical protein